MLEKLARIPVLYDIYGPLLTPRQSRCVEMYYHEDLSLGEIAESLHITRQAVYDQLRRAEAALEGYESRLRMAARQQEARHRLEELASLLADARPGGHLPGLHEARRIVDRLLGRPGAGAAPPVGGAAGETGSGNRERGDGRGSPFVSKSD